MMLADILRRGFANAHQRVGLIFLDISWKIVWAVLTAGAITLAAFLIFSDIGGIGWEDTGIRSANAWIAAALIQQFWNAHRGEMFWVLLSALLTSATVWIVLEALCRRKIVRDLDAGVGTHPENAGSYPLKIFLTTGAFRYLFLLACGLLLVRVSLAGAWIIAAITFLAIMFLLTLADTLIRVDAVELAGTDLFRVVGLIGILVSFEGMIAGSFAVVLLAGFLNVSRLVDALAMLGVGAIVVLFLSLWHSYLLLVRFSAIAIMRRNVVDV
jgi:hypothetical protein